MPNSNILNVKEQRRLRHYFYGTTYLAVVMCGLRGKHRAAREKYLFTNLSALAYFFDDLVDSFRGKSKPEQLWRDNPEEYGVLADERGLAQHFLHNINQNLPKENLAPFRGYMLRVFNEETAGRQHKEPWVNRDLKELESITAEKGGCSVLLFRQLLENPLAQNEEIALFQFGYLIQLCDDIFDLWHDHQAKIITVATNLAIPTQITVLKQVFERQVTETIQAFRRMDYPPVHIETSLRVVHFVVSITRVCLDHYQHLEKKYIDIGLPLNARNKIVVDMERWRNRFRALRHLLQPLQ